MYTRVEIRIFFDQRSDRSIVLQLPMLEEGPIFVVGRHVHFPDIDAGTLVSQLGFHLIGPEEWKVNARRRRMIFRASPSQYARIFIFQSDKVLVLESSFFVPLKGAQAGEAYTTLSPAPMVIRLTNIYSARTIRPSVSNGLDTVTKRSIGQTATREERLDVMNDESSLHRLRRRPHRLRQSVPAKCGLEIGGPGSNTRLKRMLVELPERYKLLEGYPGQQIRSIVIHHDGRKKCGRFLAIRLNRP